MSASSNSSPNNGILKMNNIYILVAFVEMKAGLVAKLIDHKTEEIFTFECIKLATVANEDAL